MNGFGHFLLRVRAFQAYWACRGAAARRRRLSVLGARHDGRLARPHGASPAAASRGRCRRCRRPRAVAHGGLRRVHLLQHQRPQSLPDGRRPAGAAGRLREEVQDAGGRPAAQDHRGQASPSTSIRASSRCGCAARYTLVEQDRQAHRHRPPAVLPGRARRGEQAGVRRAGGARGRRRADRLAQLQAGDAAGAGRDHRPRLRPRAPARTASPTRARSPTSSTTARSSTAACCCRSSATSARGELTADRERKKFGLPPSERARDRDDPGGPGRERHLRRDADFITFETTVSTEEDQIAIAPGYLQKEWTQDGRRYFEYKMDSPILNFFAFQSGTLRGEEGPLERRRHRGLLPAGPRVQPRPDDRGDQGRARLLHAPTSARTSTSSSGSSSFRATRRSRSRSPTRSRTPRASASSPACARTTRTTSTIRTT